MDQLILESKLESLRRCLERVEAKTPADADELTADPDLQDILVLNLTRAVQLCVDIGSHIISDSDATAPSTMGDVFDALVALDVIEPEVGESMRKAVGFRNIAIHNYEKINWDIVHAICVRSVEDFRLFAGSVVSHFQN